MGRLKLLVVISFLFVGAVPHATTSPMNRTPDLTITAPTAHEVEGLVKLARKGDALAQFRLAHAYETGHGTRQSYSEAIRWYKLSANQGLPQAQFGLAQLYEDGRGVKRDFAYALSWYEEAARNGFKHALDRIQTMTQTQ